MSTTNNNRLLNKYFHYILPSMFSMIGFSLYILADTFFVSQAEGANGITVLNLCLPYYDLIFGMGHMIGNGFATKYAILKSQGNMEYRQYYTLSLKLVLLCSIPFILAGQFLSRQLIGLLGADSVITDLGAPYLRIALLCTPFFSLSFNVLAFIRNDNDPRLAMVANIIGTMSNIVLDYVFMFVFDWGIEGAAIATGLSPVISLAICLLHFRKKDNELHIIKTDQLPLGQLVKRNLDACKLGVSALVIQLSEGVISTEFNFLTLKLAGNVGIASYGIISNYSIMVIATLSGLAEGTQPLVSNAYGMGDKESQRKLLRYSIITAEAIAAVLFAVSIIIPGPMVQILNSENLESLANIAGRGITIYFAGFIFAAFNIVLAAYLNSANEPKKAAVISTMRGFAAIVPSAFILANVFGMTGVWLSFGVAEAITMVTGLVLLLGGKKKTAR